MKSKASNGMLGLEFQGSYVIFYVLLQSLETPTTNA